MGAPATVLAPVAEGERIATLDLELRPMLKRITDTLAHKFAWEFVALVTIGSTRLLLARTNWARALRRELRALVGGATGAQLAMLGVSSRRLRPPNRRRYCAGVIAFAFIKLFGAAAPGSDAGGRR